MSESRTFAARFSQGINANPLSTSMGVARARDQQRRMTPTTRIGNAGCAVLNIHSRSILNLNQNTPGDYVLDPRTMKLRHYVTLGYGILRHL